MIANTDCTVYSRVPGKDCDTFKMQYIPECWWFCDEKSSITTDGLKSADVFTVRIEDLSIKVAKGDYLVRGRGPKTIQTVRDIAGFEYFKVTSANYNRFGSNPHIKVVGA